MAPRARNLTKNPKGKKSEVRISDSRSSDIIKDAIGFIVAPSSELHPSAHRIFADNGLILTEVVALSARNNRIESVVGIVREIAGSRPVAVKHEFDPIPL